MKWFSEVHKYESKINGAIIARRDLGVWRVSVENCGQTTDYTRAMWSDAFRRILQTRTDVSVTSVLMLGLGAGGEIRTLHKKFPGCAVTAIEHDPAMTTLARKLKLYEPCPFPTTLTGEASEVVPTINRTFDLIIFDLFLGPEPSPLAQNQQFITLLKERMASNGALVININQRPEYLSVAKKIFPRSIIWKYRFNTLGAFW